MPTPVFKVGDLVALRTSVASICAENQSSYKRITVGRVVALDAHVITSVTFGESGHFYGVPSYRDGARVQGAIFVDECELMPWSEAVERVRESLEERK